MTAHALVIAVLLAPPDFGRLGSDDYREREAETQRLNNPLAAFALPPSHSNPEIDARVKYLRTRNLKPWNPWWQEQHVYRDDFPRWVREYLLTGTTRYDLRGVYDVLCWNADWYTMLRELGIPAGWGPPNDFHDWMELLRYHWHVAPYPKEREP